jgi:hypothetical protein
LTLHNDFHRISSSICVLPEFRLQMSQAASEDCRYSALVFSCETHGSGPLQLASSAPAAGLSSWLRQ